MTLISPIFALRQLSALAINTHNQSIEGWERKYAVKSLTVTVAVLYLQIKVYHFTTLKYKNMYTNILCFCLNIFSVIHIKGFY